MLVNWKFIRPFLTTWLIFGIGILLLTSWQSETSTHVDFRAMYSAGILVRTDPHNLFDIARQNEVQSAFISKGNTAIPYFHPSYEALLYEPFARLTYQNALRFFQVFSLVLLIGCFLVLPDLYSEVIPFIQPRPGLMFFAFIPIVATLLGGQDSIVILLLLSIAWACLRSEMPGWAGFVTALALFKFQFVLVIGILLAIRWGKRFAISFAATAAALCALSVAIVGRTGTMQYIQVLRWASLSSNQGSEMQLMMAVHPLAMTNLYAVLYAAGTRFLSPHIAAAVIGFVSLVLLAGSARCMSKSSMGDGTAFSLAILCGLSVSGHLYIHDVSLLLLPLALVGSRHRRLMAACYCAPTVAFFTGNAQLNFIVAIPLLLLTVSVLIEKGSVPEVHQTPLTTMMA